MPICFLFSRRIQMLKYVTSPCKSETNFQAYFVNRDPMNRAELDSFGESLQLDMLPEETLCQTEV